ncbi:MAG: hypothetical protein IPM54_42195 [Polyangiaceae bacterium]|nr:hypothetical protein [Polyangiaceae bacterium]
MHRFRLVLPILACFGAACVPFPHDQREAPAMQGVLLVDGAPASGVLVRRAVNADRTEADCPAGSAETRTDAEGRFSFPSTSYFSAFIVMGDRYDAWRVCFDKPDGKKAVWEGGGYWGGPPILKLRCEMGAEDKPEAPICTATEVRR